ncbi:hypothetical protein TEHAB4_19640 [Tetragenococcus halophilus]|uniref:TIR domain-containing protein n=1 Tax=Tetragenococcus halophilus TaxID=51669 RepID=UPI00255F28F9|nr:hypothetical protein [Tetragenococcus halophilus]GMG62216.1 hypothetical protein TEHAB4_19640 [Tetragenococcus halophilus]
MVYKNGNYSAFYVSEPFHESSLGANATKDFVTYNMLRAWKGRDTTFPFNDSHNKNYNVRDGSNWEVTLKPRLHERLSNSKNIILILSSITKNSVALREEIRYGVDTLGLPIIVIYPEYKEKKDIADGKQINYKIKRLWESLPIFNECIGEVPTLHVPYKKELIRNALIDKDFMVNSKCKNEVYFY